LALVETIERHDVVMAIGQVVEVFDGTRHGAAGPFLRRLLP
jgi:hypothetical protein